MVIPKTVFAVALTGVLASGWSAGSPGTRPSSRTLGIVTGVASRAKLIEVTSGRTLRAIYPTTASGCIRTTASGSTTRGWRLRRAGPTIVDTADSLRDLGLLEDC